MTRQGAAPGRARKTRDAAPRRQPTPTPEIAAPLTRRTRTAPRSPARRTTYSDTPHHPPPPQRGRGDTPDRRQAYQPAAHRPAARAALRSRPRDRRLATARAALGTRGDGIPGPQAVQPARLQGAPRTALLATVAPTAYATACTCTPATLARAQHACRVRRAPRAAPRPDTMSWHHTHSRAPSCRERVALARQRAQPHWLQRQPPLRLQCRPRGPRRCVPPLPRRHAHTRRGRTYNVRGRVGMRPRQQYPTGVGQHRHGRIPAHGIGWGGLCSRQTPHAMPGSPRRAQGRASDTMSMDLPPPRPWAAHCEARARRKHHPPHSRACHCNALTPMPRTERLGQGVTRAPRNSVAPAPRHARPDPTPRVCQTRTVDDAPAAKRSTHTCGDPRHLREIKVRRAQRARPSATPTYPTVCTAE